MTLSAIALWLIAAWLVESIIGLVLEACGEPDEYDLGDTDGPCD